MQLTECPSLERLQAGLEGSAEGPVLARHVESCRKCQAKLESLAAASTEVDGWLRHVKVDSIVPYTPVRDNPSGVTVPASAEPTPGQRIDEYRLECPLGEGGMGAVWRAVHLRLDKPVALKLLNQRLAGRHDAMVRFDREMKAVGRL